MLGRRGVTTWMYEVIISLILLAFFAVATFTYIAANANGQAYFSRFFALDLATSADVVNAGYGDVVLRYDNLKPSLGLEFRFTNGRVGVGPGAELAAGYYGRARTGSVTLASPSFLLLRKVDGGFVVSDAGVLVRTCPVPEDRTRLGQMAVFLSSSEGIRRAFADALRDTQIRIVGDPAAANITLEVQKASGEDNQVTFSPAGEEGISFGCYFMQQLAAVSPLDFGSNKPQQQGEGFSAGISITTNDVLTDEQVGRALAHALVVYGR